MTLFPVVIALGSNLGERRRLLRSAVRAAREYGVSVVRVSGIYETVSLNAPAGSPPFLNAVLAGYTSLSASALMASLHELEKRLGRTRGRPRAPRTLDLDLILYGAELSDRSPRLPHPRFREREFVLAPLRELALPWMDPCSGRSLQSLQGAGRVERVGELF